MMLSVIIGFKNRNARKAPSGSAIPDIKVYPMAFFRLPVALKTGTEILIPSGILCNAIAIVNDTPRVKLALEDRKVAIPSGML